MNFIKIGIPFLLLALVYSCKPDKQAQLAKLQKEHDNIAEQIKVLEKEVAGTDTTKDPKGKPVSVLELKPETFKHYIEIQGKLDAEENVAIVPEVGGNVTSVKVKVGDYVKQGQVLATIDNAGAHEQLQALETQYALVKETFEKQERLWNQKIGSEMQYLQAKTAKENLESQLAATRKQLDKFVLRAPINGSIGDVGARVGQLIAPPAIAFRIVNLSGLKVVADVAEAYANKISSGDDVLVFFPDLNKEIPAKISAASKYISPVNRTFQVEVRLGQGHDDFKANMIAVLKINDYKKNNTISVPINYIQNDNKGSYAMIADGGKAKKVYVRMGQTYNGVAEIVDGLKPGDKIITAGQLDLEDGQAIKI